MKEFNVRLRGGKKFRISAANIFEAFNNTVKVINTQEEDIIEVSEVIHYFGVKKK